VNRWCATIEGGTGDAYLLPPPRWPASIQCPRRGSATTRLHRAEGDEVDSASGYLAAITMSTAIVIAAVLTLIIMLA
jgi:hypothetical protein